MGYTHYWRRPEVIPAEAFAAYSEACKGVCTDHELHMALKLRYGMDWPVLAYESDEPSNPPVFTKELVRFNGVRELGHETFYVKRIFDPSTSSRPSEVLHFEFCKTAQKPYDIAVVACLALLQHYCPEVVLSSDGSTDELAAGHWVAEMYLAGVHVG